MSPEWTPLEWRRGRDSNPRYGYPYAAFRVRCFQPLSHLSAGAGAGVNRARDGAVVSNEAASVKQAFAASAVSWTAFGACGRRGTECGHPRGRAQLSTEG